VLSTNACDLLGLSTKSLRIIDGAVCGNLETSPVVRLQVYDRTTSSVGLCTANVITKNKILTAAHCVSGNTTTAVVSYGDATSQQSVRVSRTKVHPKFAIQTTATEVTAFNDVAILTLSRDLPTSISAILGSSTVTSGDTLSIFGYGVDENGTRDFQQLRSGQMKVSDVTESHIFAEFNGQGSDTCQGDSGGPAFVVQGARLAIAGIVSTGTDANCKVGDVTLFTKLSKPEILDFIRNEAPEATIF